MEKIKKYFKDVSNIIENLDKFQTEILKIKKVILDANKLKKKYLLSEMVGPQQMGIISLVN